MFKKRLFDQKHLTDANHLAEEFRAKNCFNKILEGDLPSKIDFVFLDGPSGNGRSVSALHLLGRVSKDCLVMIDDCDHHPYISDFFKIFDCEVLVREQCEWIHPLFSYCLLRLRSPRN